MHALVHLYYVDDLFRPGGWFTLLCPSRLIVT